MSFRTRLLLFFTIIVVVPMGAVALVLFSITSQSELGKADARIAEGMRVAFSVYRDDREQALPQLRRIARDPALRRALGKSGPTASHVLAGLVTGPVRSVALYDNSGKLVSSAGAMPPVAPALATPTDAQGTQFGSLAVSTTTASSFAGAVAGLTELDVRIYSGNSVLASTLPQGSSSGARQVGQGDHRRQELPRQVRAAPGAGRAAAHARGAHALGRHLVLDRAQPRADRRDPVGFVGLALVLSVFIVRALQGQIDQFLRAARRLARGDFSQPVPTHGDDEFAALGQEFNKMSRELEGKIEEVESKRRELEETIRRVGDAFAAGLDRQGLLDLAVRTAVEACEGEAGRAVPVDARQIQRVHVGGTQESLVVALEAAEKDAFKIGEDEHRRPALDPRAGPRRPAARAAPAHDGRDRRRLRARGPAARAGGSGPRHRLHRRDLDRSPRA